MLEGTLSLEEFNVASAANALNQHCGPNHMGSDGVVKLFDSVYIIVKAEL